MSNIAGLSRLAPSMCGVKLERNASLKPAVLSDSSAGTTSGHGSSSRKALISASRRLESRSSLSFLDAKAKLASSQQRQRQLTADLTRIEAQVAEQSETLGELAGLAYRSGRLGPLSALLNSGSPDGLLDRAATLSAVTVNQDTQVRALVRTREEAAQAKGRGAAQVYAEIIGYGATNDAFHPKRANGDGSQLARAMTKT